MAGPKSSKSKKAKAKSTTVKKTLEPIFEEAPKKEPQSYLVPIAFQREPVNKDIPVADIFYHKASNSFNLQCHAPQHEAHIEMIVEGDISIEESGNIRMVSKAESPVSWIINLNNSREFSGNPFIAGEAQEIYEA
jgi:hypothetical protein|tara:strand:+ start:3079 stop:3483 length:405 start_codon:yes stop_codon:yes gene_type:complete